MRHHVSTEAWEYGGRVLLDNVGRAKAQERTTAADVVEVVVGVRDVQRASVFVRVAVCVAYQGTLGLHSHRLLANGSHLSSTRIATYMVMEVRVRDGNKVGCMRQVHQPIIHVLIDFTIARQVAVVNPHIGGQLDRDAVAVIREDLADLHVADNDVALLEDCEADALQGWAALLEI